MAMMFGTIDRLRERAGTETEKRGGVKGRKRVRGVACAASHASMGGGLVYTRSGVHARRLQINENPTIVDGDAKLDTVGVNGGGHEFVSVERMN